MEFFSSIVLTIVLAMLYRVTLGAIFETNVGRNKKKDIESLLTFYQWLSALYIKQYIEKYRIRYHIFMGIYYSGFVMLLSIFLSVFFPVLRTYFWINVSGESNVLSIYWTVVGLMVLTIPMHILPKKAWYDKEVKRVYTFDETVERLQAAQQVWDTIPSEGHHAFRKKILSELQKRVIDMQSALMDERLKIVGLSEEDRERSVQYAWNCLCIVEDISSKAGMPKMMRKESPVIMMHEDLEYQFDQAYHSFQQAQTETKQSHDLESMISVVAHFAYRMKRIHQNNVSVHRDDSSAIIEQYQIFQNMLNRAGDCPQREREQDLFDSVQEIYNFAIKQDVL